MRSPTPSSRGSLLPAAADGVPAAVEEEDAAPGVEAVGHQRGVVAEEIAPAEAGAFQEVDLGHDEVAQLTGLASPRAVRPRTGIRTAGTPERRAARSAPQSGQFLVGASPSASWPSRSTSCSSEPCISVDVPKSSTMQSVLTTPGCSCRIDGAQAAPDHLDHRATCTSWAGAARRSWWADGPSPRSARRR